MSKIQAYMVALLSNPKFMTEMEDWSEQEIAISVIALETELEKVLAIKEEAQRSELKNIRTAEQLANELKNIPVDERQPMFSGISYDESRLFYIKDQILKYSRNPIGISSFIEEIIDIVSKKKDIHVDECVPVSTDKAKLFDQLSLLLWASMGTPVRSLIIETIKNIIGCSQVEASNCYFSAKDSSAPSIKEYSGI